MVLLFSSKVKKLIEGRPLKKYALSNEELEEIIINNWVFDLNDVDDDNREEEEENKKEEF